MENKLRENLRANLDQLRKDHEALLVTVSQWNKRRREITEKLNELEEQELKLKVEIWRLARDCGQTELGL
jgi:cell division septum initiation protein DivIVA